MKDKQHEGLRAVFVSWWLAVAAFALIMVVTGPHGIGMTSDSVVYCQAAKSFARGEGFLNYSKAGALEPLTHFPPLYPAVLSMGNYLGIDTMGWARMVSAFLFGLNVFLSAMLAFYLTGRRRAAMMSGVLALISVHMAEIHGMALSEPLFLTLMFLFFWFLMRYIENGKGMDLIIAGLLSGAAVLVRYGGMSIILTGVIVLSLYSKSKAKEKLLELLIFFVTAVSFPAVWFIRNMIIEGSPMTTSFGWFTNDIFRLGAGFDTVSMFLLPTSVPMAIRWVILTLFLAALALLIRNLFLHRHEEAGAARLNIGWLVLGTFIVVYVTGTLIVEVSVAGGQVPLDRRILLPILAAAIVLTPTLLRPRHFQRLSPRMLRMSALLFMIFLVVSFLRTAQLARNYYRNGYGYNSNAWAGSELVKNVKTLADDVPVYSNNPTAFYFYAGRPAVLIPQAGEDISYFQPLGKVKDDFASRRAVAVVFEESKFRPHLVWWELARSLPISTLWRDGWGAIYGYKKPAQAPALSGASKR